MSTEKKGNEIEKKVNKLREEINFHNYQYHVLDEPLISDREFDQLLIDLRKIEEEHPELITPDSPTQRVGSQPSERFTKVQHPAPILSLANAFNADEVRAWYERLYRLDERVKNTEFVVEPKIDGLSVILHYRDGVFIQGATRGNGEVGEDITTNLRTIPSIPLRIPIKSGSLVPPSYLVVRGEVFMYLKEFDELNRKLLEQGEKPYLNPRNTAAGSLRQLDPVLTASRPLNLLTYSIVTAEGDVPETQWDRLQFLKSFGFPVSKDIYLFGMLDETIKECEAWNTKREQLAYEIDGMVIKINDLVLAADLGYVGKDPRSAIAFKFPAREVTTRLFDIGINVGRTGVLTPYAILEPVDIGGVIVKQATLHNFDYIYDKDIRIGDMVRVKRAGEVIPYVIGPEMKLRNGKEIIFYPPDVCPECGEPIENIPGEVAWYCVNSACPEQLIRNIEHFVSRGAMDIVGLGIKNVEQLVSEELIKDVADIFTLKKEDLIKLEGFANKKADNLLEAINESRQQPLQRLIIALGIRGVGEVASEDLADNYSSLDVLSKASQDELQLIEGFGPNISQAIVDWFASPTNLQLLEKLRSAGVWPSAEIKSENNGEDAFLSGLVFVITGTLPTLSRQEAKEYIKSKGGKVTSSVSKNTSFIVAGENPGSKLDKARELNIEIIDENGLKSL